MKLLQETVCQCTLPRALKRKLGVSRFGEEQMSCWIDSKKAAIPLIPCERVQGRTLHYVHYCTECCILQRNSCRGSYFPRIAGMESCLWMNDLVLGHPTSTVSPTTCYCAVSRGTTSWEPDSWLRLLSSVALGIAITSVMPLSTLG